MKTNLANEIHYQTQSGILSTQIAIASFLIGTLIMLLSQVFPNEDGIVFLGLFFVVFAFLINAAMLVLLIYFLLTESEHREYFAVKILILLANIPVVILYLYMLINPISNI